MTFNLPVTTISLVMLQSVERLNTPVELEQSHSVCAPTAPTQIVTIINNMLYANFIFVLFDFKSFKCFFSLFNNATICSKSNP